MEIMQEDRLKKQFKTLLLAIFDDPKPLRIKDISINMEVYPYHVELLVDFATKIGKVFLNTINL